MDTIKIIAALLFSFVAITMIFFYRHFHIITATGFSRTCAACEKIIHPNQEPLLTNSKEYCKACYRNNDALN